MNTPEQTFLDIINNPSSNCHNLDKDSDCHSATDLASLYIFAASLSTSMEYVNDQIWLRKKQDSKQNRQTSYSLLLHPLFTDELSHIEFLRDYLIERGIDSIRSITKASQLIERQILELISYRQMIDQKIFIMVSLDKMSALYLQEETRQADRDQSLGHLGPCLYRTFDSLDKVLGLDYLLDREMTIDHKTKERLYQGSGVTVQSGYSSILLALDNINLAAGDRIIDLGSGYGRVALVFSILRPDIHVTGYEYISHRVENSNQISQFLNLNRLDFKVQDLSLPSFQIPEAEVYYLYDPFTTETYQYVLDQIVMISKSKNLTIITKGNAKKNLDQVVIDNSWPEPQIIDEGNLCIYRSSI